MHDLPRYLARFSLWREMHETGPFSPVTAGEFCEGPALLEDHEVGVTRLVLYIECMISQLDNPVLSTPRTLGFVDWEAVNCQPIFGGTAAREVAKGLQVLANLPGADESVAGIVRWLENDLLYGPEERRKLLAVIVLEHLGLGDINSHLRPFFRHWWKNKALARLLEEAYVKRW